MQIRAIIGEYVNNGKYNPNYNFGYFLGEYLHALKITQTLFAKQVNLQDASLSRLLHNQEEPTEKFIIKLGLHSDDTIPAIYWLELYQKQKKAEFKTIIKTMPRQQKEQAKYRLIG